MIRTPLRTVSAALLAASIGVSGFAAPAAAGGSVSISIAPGSADSERAMRAGLQLYSIFNAVKGSAAVRQKGSGNNAGIAQIGRGNFGVVHQDGHGHNGTLRQNGGNNAYGLFQFGRNTNGHVVQNGHGRTGATFQFGW